MLPPIEDSILQSNPKFAALHGYLTKSILNPSGSTKQQPMQKERDAVSEALKAARIRAAKIQLLSSALSDLDFSPPSSTSSNPPSRSRSESQTQNKPQLPSELIELVLILSARLSNPSLTTSQTELLESTSQWASLPTHLPVISSLISSHLHNQALALARIMNPTTNASYLHRGVPKLVGGVQDLQRGIGEKKADLQKRRISLVGKTTILLTLYHLAISLIIRILEQSKHGVVARHVRTKAEYLALTAKQVQLEVKEKGIRGEKMVYTEEVNEALGNYMANLRDGRERLRERKRDAERVLWGYGVGRKGGEGGDKEKVMKEIARVYGEMIAELREVGRDVDRLRGR